jgi:hypothetical protein
VILYFFQLPKGINDFASLCTVYVPVYIEMQTRYHAIPFHLKIYRSDNLNANKGPGQEKELLGSYHFYPYGMPMQGLFHQQALVNNAYQYNGIDYLTNGDLNVNHATCLSAGFATGGESGEDTGPSYRKVVAE